MKIKTHIRGKEDKKQYAFANVKIGEIFRYNNEYFIATKEYVCEGFSFNALNLTTGAVVNFGRKEIVSIYEDEYLNLDEEKFTYVQ